MKSQRVGGRKGANNFLLQQLSLPFSTRFLAKIAKTRTISLLRYDNAMKRTSWPIHKDYGPFAPIRVVIVGMHSSSGRKKDKKKREVDVLFGKAGGSRFCVIRRKAMKKAREEILLAFISRRRDETADVSELSETSARWFREKKKERDKTGHATSGKQRKEF